MIVKRARLSPCNNYRYTLYRQWSLVGGRVTFLMFNPSTADANVDDHTIRKCMGFASRWGYGSLTVINLFAYRSRYPDALRYVADPIGVENDASIECTLANTHCLVCAWGCVVHIPVQTRERVRTLLSQIHAKYPQLPIMVLGLTKGGTPRHPLMLAYSTELVKYEINERVLRQS